MARMADETRARALEAVMRCFWTHGFEAASLARLEAATGMGRQSLYNALGSKEEMFAAALDRYRARIGAPLAQALRHEDPEEAVRAFLEGHLVLLDDRDLPPGCMIASCTSELGPRGDHLGERMQHETAQSLDGLRALFHGWQRDGRLDARADPDALASLLAAVVRGMAVLDRGGATGDTLRGVVDGALASFRPFFPRSRENRS